MLFGHAVTLDLRSYLSAQLLAEGGHRYLRARDGFSHKPVTATGIGEHGAELHEPGPLVVPNWLFPQQSTVPFESTAQDVMPGEMAVTTTPDELDPLEEPPDELDPLEEPGRDEPPVLWLHPTKTANDEQRLSVIRVLADMAASNRSENARASITPSRDRRA